ncbi:putative bifunctional diguanylate cyclase/phosphodiesterase [Caldalkalibacillus salinus]|uniref:putative bifunctional diguanylate cyclase/phosphodiesterase n=1 Tax=Caldalkalibacillus salinus TaxID=2803787 RepID=UPI0019234DAD|nr:EAL domain-containing protein [Caldalkalibacillus salinus]
MDASHRSLRLRAFILPTLYTICVGLGLVLLPLDMLDWRFTLVFAISFIILWQWGSIPYHKKFGYTFGSPLYYSTVFLFGLETTMVSLLLAASYFYFYQAYFSPNESSLGRLSYVFMLSATVATCYFTFVLIGGEVGMFSWDQFPYYIIAMIVSMAIDSVITFIQVRSYQYVESAQYYLVATILTFILLMTVSHSTLFGVIFFVGLNVLIALLFKRQRLRFEKIYKRAYFDNLTGLPNRFLFTEKMELQGKKIQPEKKQVNILLIGIDRFKLINDIMGHASSDRLLKMVAERLLSVAPVTDQVYRVGGDEFAFLLTKEDSNSADQTAQYILDVFKTPFVVDEQEIHLSVSVGGCYWNMEKDSVGEVTKYAEVALAEAKKNGGHTYSKFTEDMRQDTLNRLQMGLDLAKAIERNELEIFYQPQFCTATKELVGAEALLRWKHPEHGYVPPNKFIPIAEENGQIIPIGDWIIRTACQQLKQWEKDGYSSIQMSINLSSRQFQQKDLLHVIKETLEETKVKAQFLKLEITESVAMTNEHMVLERLFSLKKLGIQLSLDDFGTGYSSMSYLQRFPLDAMKVDRSFIRDIHQNKRNYAIVKSTIALAQSLGLEVVAEGVETEEEFEVVRKLKGDMVQGFLLGRPLPNHEFEAMLAKQEYAI